MKKLGYLLLALPLFAATVLAQDTPPAATDPADWPFQTRYAANLQFGESYINIVNTGATGAPALGPGFGATTGNICVNVYAFDASEELIACCSCSVTPDQVVNLGVNRDLTSKSLTGVIPTSVTVKLLATKQTAGNCNNTATVLPTEADALAPGLAAWGTTVHATPTSGAYATTETAFVPTTLNASEVKSIIGRCASIVGNASGFGVCSSCRAGALGATKM